MHKVNPDGQYIVGGFEALAVAALDYARIDDTLWRSLRTGEEREQGRHDHAEATQRLCIAAANFVINTLDTALGKQTVL